MTTGIENVTLIETYERDDYGIWGLWEVDTGEDVVRIGACVGVPRSQHSAYDAGADLASLATAECVADGDDDGLTDAQRESALAVLSEHAAAILERENVGQHLTINLRQWRMK